MLIQNVTTLDYLSDKLFREDILKLNQSLIEEEISLEDYCLFYESIENAVNKIKTIPQLKIILDVDKINKLFESNLAILN